MKIDIDMELLDEISDPEIRDVFKRFSSDGFAVFKNNHINKKISRAAAPLRDKKVLITSNDRRTDLNILSVNNNILNADKLISASLKAIIKELK